MHARLDIAGTGDDAPDLNELADVLRFDIAHLHHVLSAQVTRYQYSLIVALKLRWDASYWVGICALSLSNDETLLQLELARILQIEATLLRNQVKASQVFIAKVKAGLRHQQVNDLVENFDISVRISSDSLHESMVSVRAKIQLDKHQSDRVCFRTCLSNLQKSLSQKLSFGATQFLLRFDYDFDLPEMILNVVKLDLYKFTLTV